MRTEEIIPCTIIDVETKEVIGKYESIRDAEHAIFGRNVGRLWHTLHTSKKRRFKHDGKLYAIRKS